MRMATGGRKELSEARGRISAASGGPSMRTASGFKSCSAAMRLRAEPGPWWRMPKMVRAVAMSLSGAKRGVNTEDTEVSEVHRGGREKRGSGGGEMRGEER